LTKSTAYKQGPKQGKNREQALLERGSRRGTQLRKKGPAGKNEKQRNTKNDRATKEKTESEQKSPEGSQKEN